MWFPGSDASRRATRPQNRTSARPLPHPRKRRQETPRRDSVADVVDRLTAPPGRDDRLTHLEVVPARPGVHADWPGWLPADLVSRWQARGIERPWSHQVEAAQAAHGGSHVVLSTGTASGKSLGYLMPALTAITTTRRPNNLRGTTVLYLSPTKALAQDQLAALRALGVPGLAATTHDGDSPREQRDWARDHGEYLLTNPDMLHRSMLPGHARWSKFFSLLQFPIYCAPLAVAPLARMIRKAP